MYSIVFIEHKDIDYSRIGKKRDRILRILYHIYH